ncbi:unnamed protein product [Nezara viridula]|uniref:BTB domain-containing protein n=1 Tax=Nezara viridula TaxID=85310 RepID=A0A9P0MR55_NEZVI|nr:unnamed protein product [Nezara viridula]
MGTPRGLCLDKGLSGVPQLLEDLQRLSEDKDSADIVFLVGREEVPVYAHRLILMTRTSCEEGHLSDDKINLFSLNLASFIKESPNSFRKFSPSTA